MTTKHESIYQALTAAYGEVGYVQKQRSPNLNYSYAGEAALIEAIRPAMVHHGITVFVKSIMSVHQSEFTTAKGSVMTRSVVQVIITFLHESGTFIDVQAAGEGMDSGDKSLNKAMTGAYKYALRQTFCIETGDDPDKTPSPEQPVKASAKPVAKPDNGLMPLADAEAVTNSEGVRYGEIPTDKLAFMANEIAKASKKPNLAADKAAEYDYKAQAIRAILAHRNGN